MSAIRLTPPTPESAPGTRSHVLFYQVKMLWSIDRAAAGASQLQEPVLQSAARGGRVLRQVARAHGSKSIGRYRPRQRYVHPCQGLPRPPRGSCPSHRLRCPHSGKDPGDCDHLVPVQGRSGPRASEPVRSGALRRSPVHRTAPSGTVISGLAYHPGGQKLVKRHPQASNSGRYPMPSLNQRPGALRGAHPATRCAHHTPVDRPITVAGPQR